MIPELGVILDAGTGIYRSRDLLADTRVLRILLSHAHLDHCLGLTFLFDILHERSVERVEVYAAVDKLEAIRTHLFARDLFPVMPEMQLKPIEEAAATLAMAESGKLKIHHFPLLHPGGSLGFRLEHNGSSMAYVTDTTATADAAYIEQIRGVDVLVHECYFPDGHEQRAELTGHSCLTPVCQLAAAANVQRLYLVHINPLDPAGEQLDLDAARRIFPATCVAEDYMTVDIF